MEPKDGTAFGIVCAGVGINYLAALQRDKPVGKLFWGGAVFGIICVTLNVLTKQNIGTLMALTFLLSSFLANGTRVFDTFNAAIKQA